MGKQSGFSQKHRRCYCCAIELEAGASEYENPARKLYCPECAPLMQMKESWQPMSSSVAISDVFTIDSEGKMHRYPPLGIVGKKPISGEVE